MGARDTRHEDLRDLFLARCVPGRRFAEVGGLWGTVNERVSVAHALGAASLAMIDVTPADADLWQRFRERMSERGVGEVACVARNVCEPGDERYEVVHCSGVLYHHPHPLVMLQALRRLTTHRLVLTSAVVQEEVANRAGRLRIPASGVLFVPALDDGERAVLAAYWKERGVEAHGITEPVSFHVDDFGPWWWLPTAHALKALCEACGFAVEDAGPTWNGDAHTLLLDPRHAGA